MGAGLLVFTDHTEHVVSRFIVAEAERVQPGKRKSSHKTKASSHRKFAVSKSVQEQAKCRWSGLGPRLRILEIEQSVVEAVGYSTSTGSRMKWTASITWQERRHHRLFHCAACCSIHEKTGSLAWPLS